MTPRSRLERLRGRVANPSPGTPIPSDFWARLSAHVAYLRGEGPRPPDPACPPWCDPAEWEGRMRQAGCLEGRIAGDLRPGQYLPGMTEEEQGWVDRMAALYARLEPATPPR